MTTGFDPNDPSTWDEEPVDGESLKALGVEVEGDGKPETKAETKATDGDTTKASATETGKDDATDTGKEGHDPDWVLTADGKHALPYQHLADARSRAREAEQRAADLAAQLEAIQARAAEPNAGDARQGQGRTEPGQRAESSSQDTPTGDELAVEIAELKAKLEEVQYEDEDLARAYRGTLRALERQQRLEQQFQSMAYQRQEAEQAAMRGEVEAAIGRNPLLQEMTADPVWLERARQVEATLAQNPESAYGQAQDWDGRFKAVVDAVQAIYGPHPAAATLKPVTVKGSGSKSKGVEALDDPIPPSISALGAGEMPETGEAWEGLAKLSPSEMLSHFVELKEKGRLGDALGRIS